MRLPEAGRTRARTARARPGRRSVVLGLTVGLLAGGCSPAARGPAGDALPPSLQPLEAVELVGTVRGPLRGVGSSADLHVVVRGDGSVWASIRQQDTERGPVHEVLVWADGVALLFDRERLRATDLGDVPGEVEAWGGRFPAPVALWLLAGRRVAASTADGWTWERRRSQWRGRGEQLGVRRPVDEPVSWTEVVWRDQDGAVHALEADVEAVEEVRPGLAWPRRIALEGTDLDARVVVEWGSLRWHEALGDSILDPLWEPSRP